VRRLDGWGTNDTATPPVTGLMADVFFRRSEQGRASKSRRCSIQIRSPRQGKCKHRAPGGDTHERLPLTGGDGIGAE